MANEAVIIELGVTGGNPIRRTCADAYGIEKGALLRLVDPNTISGANIGVAQPFAGIAAAEKVANDGSTSIACYTEGVFDLYADGAITVGDNVCMSGANKVASCGAISGGCIVGYAEETATAAETIRVRLRGN